MKPAPTLPNAGKQNLPGIRTPSNNPPLPVTPDLVLQPRTHAALKRGFDLVAQAVRPTLGPLPRLVALERLKRGETPEFLDDGATIGRRILQIVPRDCDVGAMLIRNALWRMHREVGDGASTMAVICQVLLDQGVRCITQFGCNAMLLRVGLEKGLAALRAALHQQTMPLTGRENITRIAQGLVQGNDALANALGEILDVIGPDGLIVAEKWNKLGLEVEYLEGTYWHLSGWFSPLFVTDPARKWAIFDNAAILISDLALTEPRQLIPVLEKCMRGGVRKLVIFCKELADGVTALLARNNQAKKIETLVVRIPGAGETNYAAAMEDIATLTDGRAFYSAAYADLASVELTDLGHAQRVWAMESLVGVFGGKGDPLRIQQQVLTIRGMLAKAEDDHSKELLQERLGHLIGKTAILRIGAATETETETLKATAMRAVSGLRKALAGGVAPGGGAALLDADETLDTLPADNESQAWAYVILGRALEEPMRAIAQNAGYQPDIVIEKVRLAGRGQGLDARSGQIVEMQQVGVLDSVLVLEKALEIAVSTAAMALTTDVIVHHRKPQECLEP